MTAPLSEAASARELLDRAVAELAALDDLDLLVGADEIAPYRRDRSAFDPGSPRFAVALPSSVSAVQGLCRVCDRLGVPVVPRGAGSGYAGGAAASSGAVVVSLERLNRVVSIDAQSQTCVVEAGVVTERISRAAAEHGLRYAPDPASVAISTIGGNIATGAGGLCCVKYGVTRDSVLGLEVVLANGELIRTGHGTIKGVAGYDLTALFVGSEGTLGIVVGATLRLLPVPPGPVATLRAFFPNAESAVRASVELGDSGLRPAMLEFIDETCLRRVDQWRDTDFLERGSALLLVQTDGMAAEDEAAELRRRLEAAGGAVEDTTDPVVADELLAVRRWSSQEAIVLPEVTLNEDIAVPRAGLARMMAVIDEVRVEFGVTITVFAHIGDGNLHANVRIPTAELSEDGALPARAWAAAERMVAAALDLGGTITGEHGIGMLKRRWLRQELGDVQYELQKRLKTVFDPKMILSPGRVFAD